MIRIGDLEEMVIKINKVMGTPEATYQKISPHVYQAQVGNYHLSGAYGGWALHQVVCKAGSTRDVLESGHVSKKELLMRMRGFLAGVEIGLVR